MRTGKETKPQGTLHRQQLFYWMGRSIDDRNRGRRVLSDELTQEVLAQLRGSLEHGLWVKTPRFPESFTLREKTFELRLPIACFTEWSLGESLAHTVEYGRIGFGFPKRWVIQNGGQSVSYFNHAKTSLFLKHAFQLLATSGWTPAESPDTPAFEALRYMLHFAKMVRHKREAAPRTVRPRTVVKAPARRASKPQTEAFTYKRRFGQPLPFVEEREWRIVYQAANRAFVRGPGVPDYFLPYVPGDELFTLVLPDSKVVSRVLENDWITERLFTPWKHYPSLGKRRVPPVTILPHSDLGTF